MADQFDFKKRLGAGYFGEVWLAYDTGLKVERALKIIQASRVPDPANLFHEAQALKAAEHPNVVRIEDAGKLSDGSIYLAMEFLLKGSVEDEAKGDYLDLSRVKRIMVDVLRGLEFAHNQGIIHRDIKPANILIADNGEAKLSDFGLAIGQNTAVSRNSLLRYNYMSHCAPEVLNSRVYSVRTDVYACGVTMYRLINGDSLLPRVSGDDLENLILSGEFPDRSAYRWHIPIQVRKVVNKAMQPDPIKRYTTASQFRHAIEQLPTFMNWRESRTAEGMVWRCSHQNVCWEVNLVMHVDGSSEVTVKRGSKKINLRRVTKQCLVTERFVQARAHAMRVLQDCVKGRLLVNRT